jgi:hypothetical protein
MPSTKAAQEAIDMMDFDEEKMTKGQIVWNWEPRPPEMLMACRIDEAGAPHYYTFECVGTITQESGIADRAWVQVGNTGHASVENSLEDRHGTLVEWPVTREAFTESVWQHSFESDKRYNERTLTND